MKILILSIANKMPQWVEVISNQYLKWINHGKYNCEIKDIKSDKQLNTSKIKNMELEAQKFTNNIKKGSFLIVLDENGRGYSSEKFASILNDISLETSDITFIIGGANGIHQSLKSKANIIIKLSDLTFPHTLVRVILLEQIYRAITILDGHPYHRE
jgi:23S rRNA (pseudouridine1915-N3)-methyltransferase